jgi:ATP-dependent RNA helicase RhlE
MQFKDLTLHPTVLANLESEGYETPTPIQEAAIPPVLDGRDLLGCAQTGTGKTAAFALPILQRLLQSEVPEGKRPIRALVLSPTRELAAQIEERFDAYGKGTGLRQCVIFGGVSQQPQTDALRAGVDVVVATPGRLLDLMNQGYIQLGDVDILVLDEADRMLDMGFIPDVRRILKQCPEKRQTLFFSATMPKEVQRLSNHMLREPEEISVAPTGTTVDLIDQKVYFVERADKFDLLLHVLETQDSPKVLIFMQTKHASDRLLDRLKRAKVSAEVTHGNCTQKARDRALNNFKEGSTRVLVATDVASRGIDVDGVTHVVNYELPEDAENYVHRIGRTGRAGATGIALAFCSLNERIRLRDIERLTRKRVEVVEDHPHKSSAPAPLPTDFGTEKQWVSVNRNSGLGARRGGFRGRPKPMPVRR